MKDAHATAAALVAQMADGKPTSTGTHGSPGSDTASDYAHRVTARLWVRMGALFGYRWTRQFGDIDGAAFNEWADYLASVPVERIKRGLDLLKEDLDQWEFPPSLRDFIVLCAGKRKGDERRVQTYSSRNLSAEMRAQERKALPKPPRKSPEEVMAILSNIGGESQRDSYDRLGLAKRWGPLPPPGEWSREIRMAEELEQKSDRNKRT